MSIARDAVSLVFSMVVLVVDFVPDVAVVEYASVGEVDNVETVDEN